MKAPKRIRVSRHFYLDELVDPYTYFTEKDHGLSRLDQNLINSLQLLRDLNGRPVYVNNWWNYLDKHTGSHLEFLNYCNDNDAIHCWSGYRSPKCKIGSTKSAHRKGRAADPKDNYHELIEKHAKLFYLAGIRRMEDPRITDGWTHIDTEPRNGKLNSIRVIDLTSHVRDITFDLTWKTLRDMAS
jgi:hypothetical protein